MKHDTAIWITGVGAVTSLGTEFHEISDNLLAGRSGIRTVQGFDSSEHPCRVAGQIDRIPCPISIDPQVFQTLAPVEQCSLNCATAALQDAGLWTEREQTRIGLILGLGAERMQSWDYNYRQSGTEVYDPALDPGSTTDRVRHWLNLQGPTATVSAACASGNQAIAQGCRWLQRGWADAVLVGAADFGVTPYSMASFGNLRALSRRNDAPQQALRPFDRDRDGMVLGEGGACFILERADAAKRRLARAYAEVAGFGGSSDASHLVTPCPEPTQGILAVQQALAMAQVSPADVDYINAHATGTVVGDISETRLLHGVFGADCPRIPVSSTKSMTGHLLGAAAAVELIACLTAIDRGVIPPTVNLDSPDPECQLRHVPNVAQEHSVRVAISNSFGFGGNNTSVVLRAI